MAAPTETYIDPAEGASNGNDHGGAGFVDGSFANATNTLTKAGAFTAATCQAGDKIYLDDNGSGEVTPGLYTIQTRTDDNNVVLTADIRSGANDPTDVRCDQHTGAVGLPWATVQHALDFTTRDAANGDRFNIKAGTDDVLAAALDFTTYGTPTTTAPWICQGYTAAAGDGGIGGISGGGSYGMFASSDLDYIYMIDLHMHNSGAANVIDLDNYCGLINCEVDNTTGDGIQLDSNALVFNCYVHNCGSEGIQVFDGTVVFNALENGTNDFTYAIGVLNNRGVVGWNVIDIDGSSNGIYSFARTFLLVTNNSVYSNGGTGKGIYCVDDTYGSTLIVNNIVEGFSGAGGVGIELLAGDILTMLGFNAFYNNTTNLTKAGDVLFDLTANDQTLSSSPFIDAANDDFRVKPSVQALGYPTANYQGLSVRNYQDIGALQRMSQMLVHPGMSGGARG